MGDPVEEKGRKEKFGNNGTA
jgi:hypothetical protein